MRSHLQRFRELDWRERRLLVRAALSLTLAGVLLHALPFERLTQWLGLWPAETPLAANDADEALAAQIGWAIGVAASRSPLEVRCLVRALAATLIGRRYRLQTTLYLGVARSEDGELKAHAWSRCGSYVMTGRTREQQFAVIARFCGAASNAEPSAGARA